MTALPSPLVSIVRDMDFASYCRAPGLNASLAKILLNKSPHHYQSALVRVPSDDDETLSLRMGKYVHAWVLTGEMPQYVVRPLGRPREDGTEDMSDPWHGNKKWSKAWAANQTVMHMSQADADKEVGMCNSLAEDETACRALRACPEREISIFCEYRGIPLKCRIDACHLGAGPKRILDLKTANDASPEGFGKAIANYDYLLSLAWYRTAVKIATGGDDYPLFAWLAVEGGDGGKPYLYPADEDQCRIGHERMELALDIFEKCQREAKWPGYFEGIEGRAILPGYFLRDHEAQTLRLRNADAPEPTNDEPELLRITE